jgi:hypothetical protein
VKRGCAPAAPPAPEGDRRTPEAALASGRSRRSWKSHPQPGAGLTGHAKTPPPKRGLAIRPPCGYSWRSHLFGLREELSGLEATAEDRAATRSFSLRPERRAVRAPWHAARGTHLASTESARTEGRRRLTADSGVRRSERRLRRREGARRRGWGSRPSGLADVAVRRTCSTNAPSRGARELLLGDGMRR